MYRNTQPGPKRGVALYSYSAEFGFEKTLEDCFEDIHDMGATGVEILANTHIENYPYPTDAWVNYWFSLCEKYQVEPVEYGHWIDCRVLQDRLLTTEEAVERRFAQANGDMAHSDIVAGTVMAIPGPFMQLCLNTGLALVVILSGVEVGIVHAGDRRVNIALAPPAARRARAELPAAFPVIAARRR